MGISSSTSVSQGHACLSPWVSSLTTHLRYTESACSKGTEYWFTSSEPDSRPQHVSAAVNTWTLKLQPPTHGQHYPRRGSLSRISSVRSGMPSGFLQMSVLLRWRSFSLCTAFPVRASEELQDHASQAFGRFCEGSLIGGFRFFYPSERSRKADISLRPRA